MKKTRRPIIMSDGRREVRIYTTKNRGRVLYQISHNFGGRRERRSFADLQEAKREANLLLNTHTRDEAEGMGMSLAEIQSYGAARRVLDEAKIPLHVAAELVTQAQRELGAGVSIVEAARYWARNNKGITRKTVLDLVEEYARDCDALQTIPGYRRNLRLAVTRFGEATKDIMLPDIRTEQVDTWLKVDEWTLTTRNHYRQRLIAFSRWAKKRGYLGMENREFEEAMLYKVDPMETEIFTSDEMRRLLEAAGDGGILPMMAIGAFAGMRSAEIKRLDWSEILWDRNLIEVKRRKSKTRARRLVPLLDNLRAWLAPFAQDSGPVVVHGYPEAAILKVAAKAGIEWRRNALRHSFCSYRLSVTNDSAKTAMESGHSQHILFRHYRALVSREAAEEWFSIYPKGHQPAKKEPQPGNVISMSEEVVRPAIKGDIGLNPLEIRKALFG